MAQSALKMTAKIEDDDAEFERLMLELEDDTDSVDIGLLADADSTLLIIGAANEFGTRDGHIPERSFIRAGVDLNEPEIQERADRLWGQIVDGSMTKQQGLSRMGEEIQRLIQKRITDIKLPPNALSTIAAKGSSNPLIDSGRLRASIRWVLARTQDGESGI